MKLKCLGAVLVVLAAVALGVAIAEFNHHHVAKHCPPVCAPCAPCAPDGCCPADGCKAAKACKCEDCKCCCACPGKCQAAGEMYGKSIVLTNPSDPGSRLVLTSNGMWIERDGQKGPMVAIFNTERQIGVGVYGPNKDSGMAAALCVDKGGEPFLQMVDPKGVHRAFTPVDFDKLKAEK